MPTPIFIPPGELYVTEPPPPASQYLSEDETDVSGHFGQDIGPEGRLLRSGPAEGCRVPGRVLQLHATLRNARAGRLVTHTAAARATQRQMRRSDGRNYVRNSVLQGESGWKSYLPMPGG
ncbi:hypothetical protein EYF80_037196 [Liparis tanakae]|uniref:Uncharacterized protein n=1 Tax=Liparis tanakae TaxID=230148 RepID=A0A4Z2GGE8_9TELE|nr:hypothetical protein EYF80_037196 [Liparis tanakae]